jgi:DNA-binding beta-propeller fold protein YncE
VNKTMLLIPAMGLVGLIAHGAQPAPTPPCAGDGYVCGQQGPEDLVPMGNDWAVASAYAGTGGVTMIRLRDRKSMTVYPSPTAKEQLDAKAYPGCPGAPRDKFTTHGVYASPGTGPVFKLMVVGHGTRESIEVFDVDTRGETPAVTWIGCVIAPEPIGLNSVRALPDGGFITTNFLPRNQQMQSMMNGEKNGEIWEWHAASGWQKVPGSEASGANGIELSADGKTLYIANWGSQSFVRLSRGVTPFKREEIQLGFRIDNIHWAKDGTLLGAGQVGQDWQVVKIDPASLKVTQIYAQKDMPGFGGGTVAMEVADKLWVGSYRGDRIAVVKAP